MRVQQSRTEVLPIGWEIPAAIASCWLFLSVLSIPAAQGAAAWVQVGDFAWPDGRVVEAALALVQGRPGVGLPDGVIVSPVLLYAVLVVAELLLLVATVLCLRAWWRTVGPGAQHGLATRHQVAVILGAGNLRTRRSEIRPDLHPRRTSPRWRR